MTGRLVASLVVCGLSALAVGCGEAPSPAGEILGPATPAASPGAAIRADLIKDWERQKAMLVAIADAMPEETFGFKSTPAQRSYAEHIMHVATVNVDVLKLVGGTVPPPTLTADGAKTKADILKALGESYDHGIALLNEQTDASITETIEAAFLGQATRARVFWFLLGHSMDTYGQLAVYLRLNGIVPPASRGV